jgi:hypothetical protein
MILGFSTIRRWIIPMNYLYTAVSNAADFLNKNLNRGHFMKNEITNLDIPTPDDKTDTEPYLFQGFSIPTYMMAGLFYYLHHGRRPGDFLMAVLKNDLEKAVAYADDHNLRNLPAYVGYMYNEMPAKSWGSPKKVKAWIMNHGMIGVEADAKAAEDEINHYDERRTLSDGSIKNTLTGEVTQPEPPHITEYGENK